MRGPLREEDAGGGCLACHLAYSAEAGAALAQYEKSLQQGAQAEPPRVHPELSLQVDNRKCFGCHSRSGRVSTSYEGWHEVHGEPPAGRTRSLPDGRTLTFIRPDVHQTLGMDCIDCHGSLEVMGDGQAHPRKRAQLRLTCQDCHPPSGKGFPSVPATRIDPESRRILALRPWAAPMPSVFLRNGHGDAIVNGILDPRSGQAVLLGKRTGKRWALKSTGAQCQSGGHARLSCGSCHTAWAPRCNSCHTGFDPGAPAYDWLADADVRGAWREKGGDFRADPPTLGVREVQGAGGRTPASVETFAPGMVMTLNLPGSPPSEGRTLSPRLYGRVEPHTTQKGSRSCRSCHNEPAALGYGRGRLSYARTPGGGRWRFQPEAALAADGLPADAWIPFLGQRQGVHSTREDVRPFSVAEQRRILAAGACLTCHEGHSRVMREALRDFKGTLARTSPRCLVPVWP
jgi:hypothetical protein